MELTPAASEPSAVLLDGKHLSELLHEEVRVEVQRLTDAGKRPPGLAIVLVGADPASQVYVRSKSRTCQKVGIRYFDHPLPADTQLDELLALIRSLNADPAVDGILVQMPLPGDLRRHETEVTEAIDPGKDVDGFHSINVGLLQLGRPRFVPCTPAGVIEMLDRAGVAVAGKRAVVIGRSNIVGKPAAALLVQRDATVTVCHSRTQNLADEVKNADIVVAAIGKPELVKGEWIKPGAVVLDVGINRVDGKLVGDVEFTPARARASYITPVPGGVGPMTIALLMKNCLRARLAHAD